MRFILILILVWHIFQMTLGPVLYVISKHGIITYMPETFNSMADFILHLLFAAVLFVFTIKLFRRSRLSYYFILLFLFLQSVALDLPSIEYQVYYGIKAYLSFGNIPVKIHPVTTILFFLLLSLRKEYKKMIVAIDS